MASIVGRAEVLSCIFFLLAVVIYLHAVSLGYGRSLRASPVSKWRYTVLSTVFTGCSMLSKEQGITASGVCVVCDLLLNWEGLARWAAEWRWGTRSVAGVETTRPDERVREASRRMAGAALKRISERTSL